MGNVATEQHVRLELMALLRYANKSEVARALGVTPQAVINWAEGRNTSPARLLQVRRLYGLTDTEKEPPEPIWVGRLEAKMDAIADDAVSRVIGAAGVPVEPERVSGLVERLEALLRLRAEDPPERTGESDPAEPAPPEQGAG